METEDGTKDEYLAEMARNRGYVLDYHRGLAEADFPVLRELNDLIEGVYLSERSLDRKTKELLFVVSLVVMRSSEHHIQSHIRTALGSGATPREVLEAIEIALPEAGVVAFQAGFEAWREVVEGDRGAGPAEGL